VLIAGLCARREAFTTATAFASGAGLSLAPDGSTSSHEVASPSGGCQNAEGNPRLPHVPALRCSRNMLAYPGSAAKKLRDIGL